MELRKYQKDFIERIKEAKIKCFVELLISKLKTCGNPVTWYIHNDKKEIIFIFADKLQTVDCFNRCEIRYCKNDRIYTRIAFPLKLSKDVFKKINKLIFNVKSSEISDLFKKV